MDGESTVKNHWAVLGDKWIKVFLRLSKLEVVTEII